MKLYHIIIYTILFLTFSTLQAQDGSPSPYSFFGLGDISFKGTTENISMGGISIYADSIHYNINNPASLSRLKFVNLNLGLSNNFMYISDIEKSNWFSSHNISYFSLGVPIGSKFGIGMGLLPVSSSGYKIFKEDELGTYTFKGDGGISRLFLSGAYQVINNLSVGIEYQYYFGFIDHENYWIPKDPYTYTKENSDVDITGSTFKLSLFYQYKIKQNHYLNFSSSYRFSKDFNAHYQSRTQLITPIFNGNDIVEVLTRDEKTDVINFPSQLNVGLGYGKTNKWFVGTEFNYKETGNFRNPFFDPSYISYKNATGIKLGGFFIPQYNSITKYWKRITYRYGAYYKNTGIQLYNEDISDFGITFGLGLPAIRGISNLNLGIELGQRGKNTGNLVKEQYINFQIGISLNDRWFVKRKIN